ncbi:C40 family peptidase [Desulfoscipio geothermicus]|uniref:NlpC/P60 family protein n=1 Tax=Desulfoscipio geothermicus DSM 3669 TaxID=1121426 RepID=A0A1I6CTY4_9FIRM|nr:C40 family peptidase [Desulfoscipio geothermicus]SFQ96704.1 NlpC/P60 family protein [Desulfoscipio geothermicus DSM 3669]
MRKKLLLLPTLVLFLSCMSFGNNAYAVPVRSPIVLVDLAGQVFSSGLFQYNEFNKPSTNTYNQSVSKIPVKLPTNNQPVKKTGQNNYAVSRAENDNVRVVLKTAGSLLGSSYVYGAEGPHSFDCSGFTRYVYDKVGVNLPHLASSQFNYGKRVSRSDLLPGDLVFFGYYGSAGIQHVGIYVGSGKFIHASTKYGVITTPLAQPYYVENYKGAVRLIR